MRAEDHGDRMELDVAYLQVSGRREVESSAARCLSS